MSDDGLSDLLGDDPEEQYHPPDKIKSVEAMKLEITMCELLTKSKQLDPEEAKLKIQTLEPLIEVATQALKQNKLEYVDNLKMAWKDHQEWHKACSEDQSLGDAKKSHLTRITKRIDKIKTELKTFGVEVDDLSSINGSNLLDEIDTEDNIGEYLQPIEPQSDDKASGEDQTQARPNREAPNSTQRRATSQRRPSSVLINYAEQDPKKLMEDRLKEYLNAIEYLRKNTLSSDQSAILAILERAEKVKQLQEKDNMNVFEIPNPVTPDDLMGMSIQQRIRKYQVIINVVTKTIQALEAIGKKNLRIMEEKKSTFPIPECRNSEEKLVKVKLKIPADFQNINKFYYKFKWMDGKQNLKRIKAKNKGDIAEAEYLIDIGHHKNFATLKCVIKIKHRQLCFADKTVHKWEEKLFPLRNNVEMKKAFNFQNLRFFVTISSDLKIEEGSNQVEMISISYTPPPFKALPRRPVEESKRSSEEAKTKPRQRGRNTKPKPKPKKSGILVPEGLQADEIENPDIIKNLWSCYYCKVMCEKLKKALSEAKSGANLAMKNTSMKLIYFQSHLDNMQNAIMEGQVTEEQYLGFLRKGIAHDKILLKYFQDSSATGKADLVKLRIECAQKELNGEIQGDQESDEEDGSQDDTDLNHE
ncbi:unnamed protein product [Moneuplotes crassus]|uniref:Uncharacterized protein n=1 Tax=Euplotes crassus TaxID=5936 RepID=A0AAD1U2B2_EUPCR|nr:unnamed protein product [Moneuplotes crassus]